jgi:tetratricopeptide (TPR) repeat protein
MIRRVPSREPPSDTERGKTERLRLLCKALVRSHVHWKRLRGLHGNKTMILEWFNAREATEFGIALADQFSPPMATGSARRENRSAQDQSNALQEILLRADREVRTLRLNFYKKAKFANSFKWRLLENGVEKEIADDVTERLVMHLSVNRARSLIDDNSDATPLARPYSRDAKYLLTQGNKCIARGDYAEAITFYDDLINLNPRHAVALNNLGSVHCKLGRYKEAEQRFRQAIRVEPNYPDAHNNLGTVLRWRGQIAEAESSLRRALKLKPNYVDARSGLGSTLVLLGRLRDARARFEKVLKAAPRNTDALLGMGNIATLEGRFDEAAAMFKRALEINPKMPSAWAAQVGLRKMTPADRAWLDGAQEIAAAGIAPLDEAHLHFAIGKYYDDLEDFERAFQSYKRANELQKTAAETYERDGRTRFVDDLIRVYSRETVSLVDGSASTSTKPVFVVGMMRSGTSLAEQIIASHRSAKGAGELTFWSDAVHEHEAVVRQEPLGAPLRNKLAEAYLGALARHSVDAPRIVDKTPVNSDYLGVIHSVFPNARIIYMRRDPIDTCLSCYFQQFSPALNFAMDMSDLAHYYREHQRLMAHWHAVLPPGTILDVPYAELVADQEGWTRKILDFLGLEWDERCLVFHETKRAVITASYWQVRQKIYKDSVARWRNYEKWIGPLLGLRDLDR